MGNDGAASHSFEQTEPVDVVAAVDAVATVDAVAVLLGKCDGKCRPRLILFEQTEPANVVGTVAAVFRET